MMKVRRACTHMFGRTFPIALPLPCHLTAIFSHSMIVSKTSKFSSVIVDSPLTSVRKPMKISRLKTTGPSGEATQGPTPKLSVSSVYVKFSVTKLVTRLEIAARSVAVRAAK
jgi:hypothetical protein